MSTPPDEPTRRLPPAAGPPPRVREREYLEPEDDGGRGLLAELEDQLRSLRTAVVLLGVLAVAALALAAWALLKGDDESTPSGNGASAARVSQLEDRVDSLETKVDNRATKGDLNDLSTQQKDLASQQKDLDDRVDKLESKGGQSQDAASKDSVDQLSQDLQDLGRRVDDIEQQQQDQGSTP